MMCGIKFVKFLLPLLLVLVPSSWLFSLERLPEEKLQAASKEQLIKIVRIYENSLLQIESETDFQEKSLDEIENFHRQREEELNQRDRDSRVREILLNSRETRLNEQDASLTMREQLLGESWKIHDQQLKEEFWTGFGIGTAVGTSIGGITGYIIGR